MGPPLLLSSLKKNERRKAGITAGPERPCGIYRRWCRWQRSDAFAVLGARVMKRIREGGASEARGGFVDFG